MKLLSKINFSGYDIKVLKLLLCGDGFYFLLFTISKIARFFDIGTTIRDPAFELTRDLGLPESYQYLKEFWVVILVILFITQTKAYQFIGWALLYAYLLADDMLKIHEGAAKLFLNKLGFISEIKLYQDFRFQDIGEFSIALFAGVLFLAILLFSYISANQEQRIIFYYMTGFFLTLIFFGVFVDMANQLIPSTSPKLAVFLADLFEDGGEMVAMSFTCWFAYNLTNSKIINSANAKD